MPWKTVLLRKTFDEDFPVSLHLQYDSASKLEPEKYLVEPDLLATFFDETVQPKYQLRAPRVEAVLGSFGEALARYLELVKNWKATEEYLHPVIFRGQKPWVEGAPQI